MLHVSFPNTRIFCADPPVELLANTGHTGPHGVPTPHLDPTPLPRRPYKPQGEGLGSFLRTLLLPLTTASALAIAALLHKLSHALALLSARSCHALNALTRSAVAAALC